MRGLDDPSCVTLSSRDTVNSRLVLLQTNPLVKWFVPGWGDYHNVAIYTEEIELQPEKNPNAENLQEQPDEETDVT